ncbi:CU044_2847 family protein [Streptomyces sp. SP17KL33]|uniref:CU044_2847 family protein n=1 Tax=Streptomyces sp. SP17KL33 TaxID=3002534 RepID=UPI002E75CF1B|nr:CU044_2847 family protein [Streptomyces sp. SP17KL33]MEE1837451.1 CU044_2847 family protein [Streptomyces sp. SP17KL33]
MESIPILVRVTSLDSEHTSDEIDEDSEGFVEHGRFPMPWRRSTIEVNEESLRLKDLQSSFEKIQSQVEAIMQRSATSNSNSRPRIAEVTAKLGISAKGGLAFVAEAGIEASIEVKFVSPAYFGGQAG